MAPWFRYISAVPIMSDHLSIPKAAPATRFTDPKAALSKIFVKSFPASPTKIRASKKVMIKEST